MCLAPETIRTHLYPEYQGGDIFKDSIGTDRVVLTTMPESDDEDDEEDDSIMADNRTARSRYNNMTKQS